MTDELWPFYLNPTAGATAIQVDNYGSVSINRLVHAAPYCSDQLTG